MGGAGRAQVAGWCAGALDQGSRGTQAPKVKRAGATGTAWRGGSAGDGFEHSERHPLQRGTVAGRWCGVGGGSVRYGEAKPPAPVAGGCELRARRGRAMERGRRSWAGGMAYPSPQPSPSRGEGEGRRARPHAPVAGGCGLRARRGRAMEREVGGAGWVGWPTPLPSPPPQGGREKKSCKTPCTCCGWVRISAGRDRPMAREVGGAGWVGWLTPLPSPPPQGDPQGGREKKVLMHQNAGNRGLRLVGWRRSAASVGGRRPSKGGIRRTRTTPLAP
jgi:hypothetical protein